MSVIPVFSLGKVPNAGSGRYYLHNVHSICSVYYIIQLATVWQVRRADRYNTPWRVLKAHSEGPVLSSPSSLQQPHSFSGAVCAELIGANDLQVHLLCFLCLLHTYNQFLDLRSACSSWSHTSRSAYALTPSFRPHGRPHGRPSTTPPSLDIRP